MARATYAVIGDPVEHSLSPRLFARAFAELGVDAHYTALRVQAAELAGAVARVRRGALAGLSVTIPHKEAILPLLDEVHPLAAAIGAVNCVTRGPSGTAHGFNTDATGLRAALAGHGVALAGVRVVILGAGGAGRAAAYAAVAAGAKGLAIANRSGSRAVNLGLELVESGQATPEGELRRRFEAGERAARMSPTQHPARDPAGRCHLAALPLTAEALGAALARADLLVNSTSVGLGAPGDDPLPAGCSLRAGLPVLDMVYRPLRTALLRRAEAAGALPIDGLWMLVHQGIEQLRLFTGSPGAPGLPERLHEYLSTEAER